MHRFLCSIHRKFFPFFCKHIFTHYYLPEPLRLYGGGDYELTNVKEMNVTKEFLELDEDVKRCQDKESVVDCAATEYLESGIKECGCVPFHLRNYSRTVRYYALTYHNCKNAWPE